jgi:DNA modification methylase
MSATFYQGDCLKWIKTFPDKSINLIYFNPPFGTTQQNWDSKLNWKLLFAEFDRILKPTGNIVIHCSVPFNYTLIREAPRPPTYSWYWLKDSTTNPFIAKVQPLRNTEEILVWKGKKGAVYYPQRTDTEIERTTNSTGESDYYGNRGTSPGIKSVKGYYQTHHIQMSRKVDGFSTRPTELVELILKSYTQEGDVVLDPTCYQGMCGAIAKRLGRRWIGIDLNFFPVKLLNGIPSST